MFFCLIFLLATHIVSCFWIIMAMLLKPEKYGDYKGTWLAKEQKEYGKNELG